MAYQNANARLFSISALLASGLLFGCAPKPVECVTAPTGLVVAEDAQYAKLGQPAPPRCQPPAPPIVPPAAPHQKGEHDQISTPAVPPVERSFANVDGAFAFGDRATETSGSSAPSDDFSTFSGAVSGDESVTTQAGGLSTSATSLDNERGVTASIGADGPTVTFH